MAVAQKITISHLYGSCTNNFRSALMGLSGNWLIKQIIQYALPCY
jgi:hypothetical protein